MSSVDSHIMDDGFTFQIEESANESVSESERSLQQNISHIISVLDSPSSETASPHSEILKGVTAFVDVRSTFENRSKAVASQLRRLGAIVVPKFTDEVTHVIFKDGRKSVQKKAEKKGVPLLSALWIEACKKSGQHVPEKEFPANIQQEADIPLALTRAKKNRSMQPKDFEHEPASKEESIKRRRRKFEKDKLKKEFFVETQPVNQALWLGSCNISVPETPPSMKKLLETLHEKRYGTNQNDTCMEGLSVQESPLTALGPKKLFDYSNPTAITNSPSSCSGVTADSEFHEDSLKSLPTPKVIPETKKKHSENSCSAISVAETVNYMTVTKQEGADTPCTTNKLTSVESVSHSTETVSSADNNLNQLPAAATSKRKRGKKKLLKLDDKPVEKLLSPALSQTSNLSSLSKPPKEVRSHVLINTLAAPKIKVKITKRKANYMCSLSSDDDLNQNSAKRSKSDANCNTFTCDEKEQNMNLTGESHVAHSYKGHNYVIPKKKKKVSTARRSCMPAVSTWGEMSLHNLETQESNSNLRCDQGEGLLSSQIITSPLKPQGQPTGNSDAEHDTKDKPHCRKSATPQKCSVKSTVVLVQKPRSRWDQLYTMDKKQMDHCSDSDEWSKATHCMLTGTVSELQTLHSSNTSSAVNSMSGVPGAPVCPLSRRSIDEFSLPHRREHKKKTVSLSSALNGPSDSEEERDKVNQRTFKTADRRKNKLKRSSGSGSDSATKKSRNKMASNTMKREVTRSLVMTSLHSHEQDIVRNVVEKLGTFYIERRVSSATTHVVCGNSRRTLNVLLAISTGCWLLSLEWVMRSLEAGYWLDEEPYEQKDYFPAAQTNRLARMGANALPFKSSLFSDSEVFFVAENTKPEHTDLVDLIRLCGGQITHCARKARVCIGGCSRRDTVGVSEKWLLDCITSQKQLPFDDYLL